GRAGAWRGGSRRRSGRSTATGRSRGDAARRRTRRRRTLRRRRGPLRDRGLVRGKRGPPVAQQLEGVPELRLRLLVVERVVDVRSDERVDGRRERLQLGLGRADLARERELDRVQEGARALA